MGARCGRLSAGVFCKRRRYEVVCPQKATAFTVIVLVACDRLVVTPWDRWREMVPSKCELVPIDRYQNEMLPMRQTGKKSKQVRPMHDSSVFGFSWYTMHRLTSTKGYQEPIASVPVAMRQRECAREGEHHLAVPNWVRVLLP